MATSVTPALRSALPPAIDTQLASDGITDVQVTEVHLGDDVQVTDAVWFGTITATQEEHTYGTRKEILNVEGFIWVVTPGAGEEIAATSEDRAFDILASIETTLRDDPTLSAVLFDATIVDTSSEPGITDKGRYTFLKFTIAAEAHI